MEVDIDAVYVRDSDINVRGNTLISMCYAAQKQYPGEIHGAQLVNGFWSIYTRSNKTRAALVISGLNINGANIRVFDDKPFLDGGKKTERVVIKDLPATIPPDRILSFLKGYPHVTIRSRVLYAKERLAGEELSPFINGDRIIYVTADVSPPLPKETVICGHHCRIWHPSQKNFCKRCANHGHRTVDTDVCEAYEPDCLVSAWRGDNNPLSNFYRCTITHDNVTYKSSEHFYQYEFCMFMKEHDIAQEVLNATTPKEAKQVASQLKTSKYSDQLAKWAKIKISVMDFILRAKWNCCAKFQQTLSATEGMVVAEATSCVFWGVGVAPNLAQHTKASKFLGQNHMGKLQMALRYLVTQSDMKDENGKLILPIKPSYDVNIDTTAPVSSILDFLIMPPDLTSQGQNNSSKDQSDAPESSLVVTDNPHTAAAILSTSTGNVDVTDSDSMHTSVPDTTCEATTASEKMDVSIDKTINQDIPPVPPRKRKSLRSGKSLSTVKSSVNTLDNFVSKESPSCKRKPSGDAGSPSSTQITKSNRTDGADTVS